MKGKFIVFEGGEGSGKTTQLNRLAIILRKKGKKVLLTHEPGGTKIADKIRRVILHDNREKVAPKTELFLFLASRAQHVHQEILPALKKGCIVLCDRFSGSTLAYQIGGRRLPDAALIRQMDKYARNNLKEDLVIYIDVDPALGLKRKNKSLLHLTRIDKEKLIFHRRVRSYFKKMANNKNWAIINGNKTIMENHKEIYEIINKKIK